MTKFKRILSFILAIAFCFVFFCSVMFIATESNHSCSGEDCPICAQINLCKDLIRRLVYTFASVILALSMHFAIIKIISFYKYLVENKTLVSLNIKLSN